MPESAELAPWAEGVPHWDELDETERRVAARFMETYAGFAEHADVAGRAGSSTRSRTWASSTTR